MGKRATPNKVNKRSQTMLSAEKRTLFSIIFGLLWVLIFVLLEAGLRIAGYGIDTRPFIVPRYQKDTYVMNTNFIKKYYPRKALTRPDTLRDMMIANRFSRQKSASALRGFLVGGSTAQGFPYLTNQSFGKMTESALKAGGKYQEVELLNLGLSAVTSYCVKDISRKLLRYQPDFLVIYAGHNEYYGTISATTGGNYFTKNLYLALQEFRLFQFLFNLRNLIAPAPEYTTLMEEQFQQGQLPLDPETDRKVAEDFIKNIDAIVRLYRKHNIPVIIIEPVSNLHDMPPFSGEGDAAFKEFIQRYAAVVQKGDLRELRAFYQDRLSRKEYDRNANARYLDALAQWKLSGQPELDGFKSAKDLDTTPFRAKEILREKLRAYCDERGAAANLHYIPLEEIMLAKDAPAAFGNEYFIDQLHFTQTGQRLVSRVLAERIAELFQFSAAEKERVAGFYGDDGRIDQAIHYLPAYRTDVYLKVRLLTENPPFTGMLIPYQRRDTDGVTEANVDPELVRLIFESNERKIDYPVLCAEYYINRGQIETGKRYLDSYLWNYPGCYRPYLIQARFQKIYTKDLYGTLATYKTAYLLSDKMKLIHDEIAAYLAEQARGDLFAEIEKYGKPIK
ncbi:MAG: hypothetical protein GX075_03690 [Firmicutes bacterium]|nr:hypothetical protein [Bacillota bacterium]